MKRRQPWSRMEFTSLAVSGTAVFLGLLPAMLTFAALLGLGMHRRAAGWAISASATLLIFGPALLAAGLVRRRRGVVFGVVIGVWSLALFLAMPVYFPGERQRAVLTGLSLAGGESWEGVARMVADGLPPELEMAEPEVPLAARVEDPPLAAPLTIEDDAIELPYEGEGRRMSVQIAFEHGGQQLETWMMLDTGATYTTLPYEVLEELGIRPGQDDPTIRLHTANGERDAQVVLLDKVWLGDLSLEGVAVATCDGCSSSDTVGLLGLNVTGGYNLQIDADQRVVVFKPRATLNRHLDIKPFVDIGAQVTRLRGGRVEVDVKVHNIGPRRVGRATTSIQCRDERWLVAVEAIEPGDSVTGRRRLPEHEACARYRFGLHSATW